MVRSYVNRAIASAALLLGLSNPSGLFSLVRADEVISQLDAQQIVEMADYIRFPKEDFQVEVAITSTSAGRSPDLRKYRILSKGSENTLVMTTAPPVDRGQVLLMRGHDLWAFLPKVSQPVRLPLSQRLTGQVANGDLARANFAGDYNANILRKIKIEGRGYYVLELTAARRYVTYHRVLYWVDQANYRPFKAEFYTRSNRLLKTCYYQKFEELEGEKRPTRLTMEDALRKGERSVMDYSNMQIRQLSDKIFTKQYLKKLMK